MLFQTFDDKQHCFQVYRDASFHDNLTEDCTATWSYAPYLKDKNIEYASLYVSGKSLFDVCPIYWQDELQEAQAKINAVLKSVKTTGISLNETCLYQLIPEHLLVNIAVIKNKICEYVFREYEKPANYEHMLKVAKMIADIKHRSLSLDLNKILRLSVQDRNTYKLLKRNNNYIDYDQFKAVTGRLTTKPLSFPIMTIAKKYRNALTPTNDWLFELDFNACELRTMLALLDKTQPLEDLHDWNLNNVFKDAKDRDNAKKRVFAWLYNPKRKDDEISRIYDRKKLKSLYFKENYVITPYGRNIDCDEDHAISYIVQSTAADLLFEQMYKIWEFLKDKKSFIKFCNHDSIMIDLHEDDQYEVNAIRQLFGQTRFGNFKVNCLGGKNWAEMRKLNIK